jgi:myo-inositol-1(or 4)-monophosphatase
MDQIQLQQIVEKIKTWALEVGELQMKLFRNAALDVSIKGGDIADLVTEADYQSEKFWIEKLTEAFPTHSILAEESGMRMQPDSEYLWSLDPIDGTVNYAYGLPIFCTSIALKKGNKILLGVINAPYLRELYWATAESPAYCNGQELRVSSPTPLAEALLSTGLPYGRNAQFRKSLHHFVELTLQARGVRRMGSAAYDLSCVAAGRLDGYWEFDLHPWDIDAGLLLVERAGGQVVVTANEGKISLVAAHPTLVADLQQTLQI